MTLHLTQLNSNVLSTHQVWLSADLASCPLLQHSIVFLKWEQHTKTNSSIDLITLALIQLDTDINICCCQLSVIQDMVD